MIRSLLAEFDEEKNQLLIRRNLSREQLGPKLEAGCKSWVDMVDADEVDVTWLSDLFNLNPAVVQDIQRNDTRPALMVYPNYIFLSLFEPDIHLHHVQSEEIHCLVTDQCFITVRHSDTSTVDEAYDRVAQNPSAWEAGVAYFLYLTAQYVIDSYYPLLDRISSRLNALEEVLLDDSADTQKVRKPIYRMKQQLIHLREIVAPQREVFSSVIGEKRLTENTNTRDLFRHLYERLLRIYDVIDSQRDLSSNVLDMIQNIESRTLVEAVNRLTIFSMIFLPLSFFTGLFELGFAQTSDQVTLPISGALMFIFVIGAMIGSAGVMLTIFRQRGWI